MRIFVMDFMPRHKFIPGLRNWGLVSNSTATVSQADPVEDSLQLPNWPRMTCTHTALSVATGRTHQRKLEFFPSHVHSEPGVSHYDIMKWDSFLSYE